MPVVTVDGNQAAAHVAYAMSETAFIFPITPATTMGELADVWANQGRKNVFGQKLLVSQMESECGAAGSVHGACTSGSLVTTFTSSQGLLLMIPDMLKISGELLPCVIHVASRVVGTQGIAIYVDHNDVMSTRSTGFAMLNSHSVQEAADLAVVAHLSTVQGRVPFLHFFDGFRTSHEICKVQLPTNEELTKLMDFEAIRKFRDLSLNPMHGFMRGTVESSEIYFQNMERSQEYYDALPDIVEANMRKVEAAFGRAYHVFDYVGHPEAERVVVMLGSATQTVEEYLEGHKDEKIGLVKIHLFRPWSAKHFLAALPKACKRIAVLDLMKDFGASGEPVLEEVCTCLNDVAGHPEVFGGRFGLGGKEFTPRCVAAVYANLAAEQPKNHFTVGINDDVCHTSLALGPWVDTTPEGTTQCMFWGLGSDGTVGANHDAIKIIGNNTDMFVQGYFAYDAHKSGGVTISHLRFGKKPIHSEYLIKKADYLACHLDVYVKKYPILDSIKDGGIFVLNSAWGVEEMDRQFPGSFKRALAEKRVQFYNIDASSIAQSIGLGRRINMVMQAVFFKLANVIPYEQSVVLIKDAVRTTFKSKGPKVIEMNIAAIDAATAKLQKIDVPAAWASAPLEGELHLPGETDFVKRLIVPTMQMKADDLPVSAFEAGGANPLGLTKFEKRGVALRVPVWDSEKCVGCNECSVVCPHAVIRPFLFTAEEAAARPSMVTKDAKGKNAGLRFRMQVSPYDCTGCTICTTACKHDALSMAPFESQKGEQENWDYCLSVPNKAGRVARNTLVGSQFYQPLLEFSGCCEGCSETAYVKMLTQLFGERLVIANASGCSSVWGGTWGMVPYTTNAEGYGPAWCNSLFEENAEFGFGMAKANSHRRELLREYLAQLDLARHAALKDDVEFWLANYGDAERVLTVAHRLRLALEAEVARERADGAQDDAALLGAYENRDQLNILSHWAIGGDGWAYDINYGGLDHVIAQGHNMNVLVLDTEMYSNTGGQKSKATNIGAIAKFAAGGCQKFKKDLGRIAMTYGDIYVASISLQANPVHAIRTLCEAEAYPGTSLVLCYSPCKEQGFPLAEAIKEAKIAVESGYWPLYRYDPRKTPAMQLDQGKLTKDITELLSRENRYLALTRAKPDVAKDLHGKLIAGKLHQHEELERLTKLAADLKEKQ